MAFGCMWTKTSLMKLPNVNDPAIGDVNSVNRTKIRCMIEKAVGARSVIDGHTELWREIYWLNFAAGLTSERATNAAQCTTQNARFIFVCSLCGWLLVHDARKFIRFYFNFDRRTSRLPPYTGGSAFSCRSTCLLVPGTLACLCFGSLFCWRSLFFVLRSAAACFV